MNMRKIVGFSVVVAAFGLVASCSDDDDDNDGAMTTAGTGGMGMSGGAGMGMGGGGAGMGMGSGAAAFAGALGPNNPPQLGDRIDRVGRVAVTAALIGAFNPATAVSLRDAYNEGNLGDPDNLANFKASLGILDGVDGVCGNQLLFTAGADPYATLAGVLNDDQLYVNSERGNCAFGSYLGVEAEAVGILDPGEGSCGGRLPNDDVINRSYSVLMDGSLGEINDGLTSDDANHDPDIFPFLGQPTP